MTTACFGEIRRDGDRRIASGSDDICKYNLRHNCNGGSVKERLNLPAFEWEKNSQFRPRLTLEIEMAYLPFEITQNVTK